MAFHLSNFSFNQTDKLKFTAKQKWLQAKPVTIPFIEVFWSEEEEKTIEYRFFNDVTKTRSMPS